MTSENSSVNYYTKLPKAVEEDMKHLIKAKEAAGKAGRKPKQVHQFLAKNLPKSRKKGDNIDDLTHKVFFIDNADKRKKRYDRRRQVRHKLTSRDKRKLGLFKLPKNQSYESFIPLHNLWRDYMKETIDFSKITEENKTSTAQKKLLKADYHGAIVTVTKSKTPSLIGQTGIIIQETKNVFKIATRDDKLKTIPKENSIFTMELEGHVLDIKSSDFRYTAAERTHRKFKFKPRLAKDL